MLTQVVGIFMYKKSSANIIILALRNKTNVKYYILQTERSRKESLSEILTLHYYYTHLILLNANKTTFYYINKRYLSSK